LLNMSKWLSFVGPGSCAVVFYLLISGCTMTDAYIEPEQFFLKALDQLSMEHYVVQWEDPGSIISQKTLNTNWNPLEDTDRYREHVSEVIIDQELSDRQGVVLSVYLDNHIAKQLLLDQLYNQMNVIRSQLPLMADGTRMNNEITEFMKHAELQLVKRIDASQVQSNMLLWVDRNSANPIKVQFNTMIDFLNNGQPMKESLTDSFLISKTR